MDYWLSPLKLKIKQHFNKPAGVANSIDLFDGLLAVAIEADNKKDTGWVAFYNPQNLTFIDAVYVGSLPDIVTFTKKCKQLVVALEGEPLNKNYALDPVGEIAVIDIDWQKNTLKNTLTRLHFHGFNQGGVRFNELPKQLVLNAVQKIDRILTFGGRSFSILNVDKEQFIFDLGSDFERITAQKYAAHFNQTHSKTKAESRSGKKGPEPEALTTGIIDGITYAFIGLERMGGIMVYNISDPANAQFVQYLNNRDLSLDPKDNVVKNADGVKSYEIDASDLGPEVFRFVPAKDSPILIVGNEVSGTTSFYRIDSLTK
jgi:hypothetical protein